jgi:hypothetical protein
MHPSFSLKSSFRFLVFFLLVQLSVGFIIFPIRQAKASGATYYVSNCGSVVGNDSNNGTSSSTPWLTIAKVNSSTFALGDSILFKKDCVWSEQLIISSSGNAGSSITFGAYGSGAPPVISGLTPISTSFTNYLPPIPTSPTAWYDGQLSTITKSGGSVSQWNDISGNNNNAVQSTSAKEPTLITDGGYNALSFNGSSSFLSLANTLSLSGLTFIAVIKPTTSANSLPMFGGPAQGAPRWYAANWGGQTLEDTWVGNIAQSGDTDLISRSAITVDAVSYNGTNWATWTAGINDASGTSALALTQPLSLIGTALAGGNSYGFYNGEILALVVYKELVPQIQTRV